MTTPRLAETDRARLDRLSRAYETLVTTLVKSNQALAATNAVLVARITSQDAQIESYMRIVGRMSIAAQMAAADEYAARPLHDWSLPAMPMRKPL